MKQIKNVLGKNELDSNELSEKELGKKRLGKQEQINEQAVIDYLRRDPDFFSRHPGLLSELNLPHASGNTVSLVEHQVAILRERNVDTRRRLNQLIQAARDNDAIFAKTRTLTLALLGATTAQELNEVLATHVLVDFDADFVCCHLVNLDRSLDHIRSHRDKLSFAQLMPRQGAKCTTLRPDELQLLFPNALDESVVTTSDSEHTNSAGSAVLIPLSDSQQSGALCIGCRDANHFTPDMDTLFVVYIADVLAKVLAKLNLLPV